jgi:zinc protease
VKKQLLGAALGITTAILPIVSPAVAASSPSAYAGALKATLSNGLRVIIAPDRLAPVVTTYVRYDAGSNDETLPGQAHAVEHMMFRGTKDVSAAQFADILARTGGEYNASTTNDATSYYFTVPSRYLGVVLRLEADRMRGALMRQSDWTSERGAIEQEVRGDESSPTFDFSQRIQKAFYGDTPYARSALGTVASFDAMKASDLRAFYDRWYHPNNATLVIAGNVDPAVALAEVRARFGAIPRGALPKRTPIVIPPFTAAAIDMDANVSYGSVGFAVPFPGIASPDYAASAILIAVLNDPRGAFAELNATGKTYGAGAFASTGPAASYAGLGAALPPGADAAATHGLLTAEIATLLKTGVSDDAVQAAKRAIVANRAFALASIPGVASAWAGAAADGLSSPDALIAKFENVQTSDVNRVLHTYFSGTDRLVYTLSASAKAPRSSGDAGGGGENVTYTGRENAKLPAWAAAVFRAPLSPPRSPGETHAYTLPNGLRLVVERVGLAPIVVMRGSVKNNQTLYAPADKQGVADMTSSLMGWGSTTLDRRAFAAATQAIPAGVFAGSQFGLQARARDFDAALRLLAQEMLHPALPAAGFLTMQSTFAQQLAAGQVRAQWQSELAIDAALYPAGDPVALHATAPSIRNLTLGDVQHWYATAFRPDLTAIAVVSDLDPSYVHAEIARYFGAWHVAGNKPTFKYPSISPNGPSGKTLTSPTTAHTTVRLAETLPIVHTNKDAPALTLADTMLTGEGAASILYADLRTRHGYVYSVDSILDIGHQRSTYSFDFAADPSNAAPALAALMADLRSLQTARVAVDDLSRAKAAILARSALRLDTYSGLTAVLLDEAASATTLQHRGRQNKNDWDRVLAVTPEQLRAAFAKWVRVSDFARIEIVPAATGSPSPTPSPTPHM